MITNSDEFAPNNLSTSFGSIETEPWVIHIVWTEKPIRSLPHPGLTTEATFAAALLVKAGDVGLAWREDESRARCTPVSRPRLRRSVASLIKAGDVGLAWREDEFRARRSPVSRPRLRSP